MKFKKYKNRKVQTVSMRRNIQIFFIVLIVFLTFIGGCTFNNTEQYVEKLKSENVMVQSEAIYCLGTLKEKSAVPVLITFLTPGRSRELRLKAIEALGEIGEKSAVDPLVKILPEKDTEIRIAAVNALGKMKDPRSIPFLVNILDDKSAELIVIWTLGNIGDKSAIPALTELLNDQDKYVRYNAAQALKKIGWAG